MGVFEGSAKTQTYPEVRKMGFVGCEAVDSGALGDVGCYRDEGSDNDVLEYTDPSPLKWKPLVRSGFQVSRYGTYLKPCKTSPSGLVTFFILHRKPVEEGILLFGDWNKICDQEKETTSQCDRLVDIGPWLKVRRGVRESDTEKRNEGVSRDQCDDS